MKTSKKFLFILLPIIVFVVAIDLITKSLASSHISYGETISAIPYIFNFTYLENVGAAWNIFSGNRALLIVISVIFIIILVLFYVFERKNGVLFHVGCALIFGGAVGNMIDRIFLGYVRDFIQFAFWKSFPVFNIADAMLTIGVVIVLIYYVLSLTRKKDAKDIQN